MDAIRNCDINYDNWTHRKTAVVSINRVPSEDFTEVATVAEAKAQLRIDHSLEDTLIGELIAAARRWAEDYTGLSLVETVVTVVIENMRGRYQLPYGPFVDTFALTDYNDAEVVDTNYSIVAEGSTVFVDYSAYGRHTMTYTAGFTEVPASLKRAVLFYVEYLYDPSELGAKAKIKAENLAKSFKQGTWLI